MIHDYYYFQRRYNQIENAFLELTDFIELKDDFESPCYNFGSSKLMDFCLNVGSEVETLFKIILDSNRFDDVGDIGNKRKKQSISVYRDVIEPVYKLSEYKLFVKPIKLEIVPFENFDSEKLLWFGIYSKYKHDKIKLIEEWNLKNSLHALGCLLILVINHPYINESIFELKNADGKMFNLVNLGPRFMMGYPAPKEGLQVGDKVHFTDFGELDGKFK